MAQMMASFDVKDSSANGNACKISISSKGGNVSKMLKLPFAQHLFNSQECLTLYTHPTAL